MLENLIKQRYMVSTSSRDKAPKGLNPNIITIIARAIPDQVFVVVDVITVVLLINQNSVWHMEKNVTGTTRKNISQSFAKAVNSLVVVA